MWDLIFLDEKTSIFWVGLIILGVASVVLFGILWQLIIWNGYGDRFHYFKYQVPLVVGGGVFIFIGLYMMKSGVKKKGEKGSQYS
jgi:putative Mn2+ efflux pump MntP